MQATHSQGVIVRDSCWKFSPAVVGSYEGCVFFVIANICSMPLVYKQPGINSSHSCSELEVAAQGQMERKAEGHAAAL